MAQSKRRAINPRKAPEQDRSRATVDAILEAAARILVKGGYDAFTTNRVAEKAGVSIGSLYQYFPNKDALLIELTRRHMLDIERGVDQMADMARSAPFPAVVRGAIEHSVRSHLVDPELHRVLSEEVPRLPNDDWQTAFNARMMARVRSTFEARRGEIVAEDLDLAAYIVGRTVEAVVHNAVSERRRDLESGALAEEVTRMIVGYLTGKPLAAARKTKAAAE